MREEEEDAGDEVEGLSLGGRRKRSETEEMSAEGRKQGTETGQHVGKAPRGMFADK